MHFPSLRSLLTTFIFVSVVCLVAACGQSVVTKPPSVEQTGAGEPEPPPPEVPADETLTDESAADASESESQACAGGVIKDDGSVETGYGYVPSATMGQYIQRFHSDEFSSPKLSKVCICLLRSRNDNDIDYEIVFYGDAGGRPLPQPYATVPATATEVPKGVAEAGRFYEVDVTGVTLPTGTSYIGARWDPSASTFFFVCTDRSEETEWTDVFSMEDRAPVWTNIKNSRDPIFAPHRSILVRAVAESNE